MATNDSEVAEAKYFATFDKLPEFKQLQHEMLSKDWRVRETQQMREEFYQFQRWDAMLAQYQEQPYLLDPFLEDLVTPVVDVIKAYAKEYVENPEMQLSGIRIHHAAEMLYGYVKFRGYKTIIRFFPHEIADLSIALKYMQLPNSLAQKGQWHWQLRYSMLLWLYLIVIIPFDLAQFDEAGQEGNTSKALLEVGKAWLGRAGVDREAASLLVSRILVRKDSGPGFGEFIAWTQDYLKKSDDLFTVIGQLHVLCEVVKAGSAEQVQSELTGLLDVANTLHQNSIFTINTIVRKYRVKLISRVALRLLPGRVARQKQVRTLSGDTVESAGSSAIDEQDVAEEVETVLEQLFEALQDKDTVVRWSAAKGVARIAERLPVDFANQVLETLIGLFEIHSIAAASLYDLPAVAEATWHGACLACAEMARRNLVERDHLPHLIQWLTKALYFDLRKGAHSIGSNVRDAAAYVLWALARTQNQAGLVPYGAELARHLVTVALYDREVHIRRAASAAFQEHVGRNNLFPHGIDVLGKIDFYAVSVRKNAFLVAAPQVSAHNEYRPFLIDHVLNVLLRHWDVSMRELGSQSLRLISFYDSKELDVKIIPAVVNLLNSLDPSDVHGGLLALTEIAIGYRDQKAADLDDRHRSLFNRVNNVQQSIISNSRNEVVAAAVCRLIANTITVGEVTLGVDSAVSSWQKTIDIGLKHKSVLVQEAAAEAMATISNMTDCSPYLARLISDMKSGLPVAQQSLAQVLSVINYDIHPGTLPQAIAYLIDSVKPKSKATIETRQSCYKAIPRIVSNILPHLNSRMSSDVVQSLFNALTDGLNDYSIDERGDVGSWIRIASIQGLTTMANLLMDNARKIESFEAYFPPELFHNMIAGILKQGVERLDNVRQEAGVCFITLLKRPLPPVEGKERWKLPGDKLLHQLFDVASDSGWQDGVWLFPRAFRLIEIPEYRSSVLSGLILSIGSRTDSIQRPVADSLVKFAQRLPPAPRPSTYSLIDLVDDLIRHAKFSMTNNAVVIPVFQAFNVLFDQGALNPAVDQPVGLASLKTLLHMASKNIDRMKNIQRIHEATKVSMHLLAFETIRKEKLGLLRDFLGHPFPRIRADSAEFLFNLFQTRDFGVETDDAEAILLETEWVGDIDTAKEKANEVVEMLAVA